MYIEKLVDENVGAIEKVRVHFIFSRDGIAKPIILLARMEFVNPCYHPIL